MRLKSAVEKAAKDLGREPDLVFLHNPEQSLREAVPHNKDLLAAACTALDEAAGKGMCAAWGVATWEPSPLLSMGTPTVPRPSVLMIRAGLLVGARTLDATDTLIDTWDLGDGEVWGMSPFGGATSASVWDRVDSRLFLQDGGRFSRIQAAFRTAYHLPRVGSIAVGTDEPTHLGELMGALAGQVEERTVQEYRRVLRDRPGDQSS